MSSEVPQDDEEFKEVYAHAGLALYLAQCFEMAMQNFIVLYHLATNKRISRAELDAVDDQTKRKTMRSLLAKVRKRCRFDPGSTEVIERALVERDYLAHHYFKEMSDLFFSSSGRQKMIDRLLEMQRTFQIADTAMEAVNRALADSVGITQEVIERELKALYERSGA